jgi:hypothetical protein
MYTIELMLKGNPAMLSVQRKDEESANEIYQQLLTAVQKGHPQVLELSCDRTGKKLVILSPEICVVQLTPKAGATSPMGTRPGFLAQVESKS